LNPKWYSLNFVSKPNFGFKIIMFAVVIDEVPSSLRRGTHESKHARKARRKKKFVERRSGCKSDLDVEPKLAVKFVDRRSGCKSDLEEIEERALAQKTIQATADPQEEGKTQERASKIKSRRGTKFVTREIVDQLDAKDKGTKFSSPFSCLPLLCKFRKSKQRATKSLEEKSTPEADDRTLDKKPTWYPAAGSCDDVAMLQDSE
jgi:hypothetical protein